MEKREKVIPDRAKATDVSKQNGVECRMVWNAEGKKKLNSKKQSRMVVAWGWGKWSDADQRAQTLGYEMNKF